MATDEVVDKVRSLADQVAKREGCLLYDVEFVGGGRGRTLRVYIDKESGGVTVDDCSNVSRGLNLLLDVEDPIPGGAYNLEVSSPGLERTLRAPWQYRWALGKRVQLRANESLESLEPDWKGLKNRRQIEGRVADVQETQVTLETDLGELKVPFSMIDRSKVVFEIEKNEPKRQEPKKVK